MRRIQLTLENTEFEALETMKESLSGSLDKPLSWEKLILHLLNNQK